MGQTETLDFFDKHRIKWYCVRQIKSMMSPYNNLPITIKKLRDSEEIRWKKGYSTYRKLSRKVFLYKWKKPKKLNKRLAE